MGKNKDAAIGFIGIGIIIAIAVGAVVILFPSESEQIPQENTGQSEETISKESESSKPATIGGMPIESGVSYRISEDGATKVKEGDKLSDEDLQTIVAGFESYNKSVKVLLDLCANVETESDFRALGNLIDEHGTDFLKNTSDYGDVRNKLLSEGYGDHPELGPLMNQSEMLVDGMSTCMEVLALEFGG